MPNGTRTRPDFNWMPESERTLRKLWASGVSAAKIAAKFDGRITRNAVIGKVHRMGLPSRPTVGIEGTWTDDEIATLRSMRAAGSYLKKISQALPGRTVFAVKGKLFAMGVYRGKRKA